MVSPPTHSLVPSEGEDDETADPSLNPDIVPQKPAAVNKDVDVSVVSSECEDEAIDPSLNPDMLPQKSAAVNKDVDVSVVSSGGCEDNEAADPSLKLDIVRHKLAAGDQPRLVSSWGEEEEEVGGMMSHKTDTAELQSDLNRLNPDIVAAVLSGGKEAIFTAYEKALVRLQTVLETTGDHTGALEASQKLETLRRSQEELTLDADGAAASEDTVAGAQEKEAQGERSDRGRCEHSERQVDEWEGDKPMAVGKANGCEEDKSDELKGKKGRGKVDGVLVEGDDSINRHVDQRVHPLSIPAQHHQTNHDDLPEGAAAADSIKHDGVAAANSIKHDGVAAAIFRWEQQTGERIGLADATISQRKQPTPLLPPSVQQQLPPPSAPPPPPLPPPSLPLMPQSQPPPPPPPQLLPHLWPPLSPPLSPPEHELDSGVQRVWNNAAVTMQRNARGYAARIACRERARAEWIAYYLAYHDYQGACNLGWDGVVPNEDLSVELHDDELGLVRNKSG
eukprot:CAMPEP_0119303982 /NCGR_PEP_ID=MMETSP1333-20130426/5315_1 /TAXON_ID=418940 /ORGANISM="Scyphosphaera apsteinii, Strain RCC1455" /LENGTH=505 /DNA_ID=CAMNT_0007306773 /DNA_START=371 /DNA_END=1889 /DNA_ORIENTATION=-